jgi:YD repeat-containing protein
LLIDSSELRSSNPLPVSPIAFVGAKLRRAVLIFRSNRRAFHNSIKPSVFCALLVQFLSASTVFGDTCLEQGGFQTCTGPAPIPGPWSYTVQSCSRPFNYFTPFDVATCKTFGGTPTCDYQGYCGSCAGAHPTDALIGPAVANGWKAWDDACTMSASPSGWGVTLSSAICGAVFTNQYGYESYPTLFRAGIEYTSNQSVPATGTKTNKEGCGQADNRKEPGAAFASRTRDVNWLCLAGNCNRYQDNTCPVGNPIRPGTGAKVLVESDFALPNSSLQIVRYYNSQGYFNPTGATVTAPGTLGDYWRTNYDRRIFAISGSKSVVAAAQRPDGSVKYFNSAGLELEHFNGSAADSLVTVKGGGWILTRGNDEVETYNAKGYLVGLWDRHVFQTSLSYDSSNRISTVTDFRGRTLSFRYTGDSQSGDIQTYSGGTVSITTPNRAVYEYKVDSIGNLESVAYPSATFRSYSYDAPGFPNALTGIVDENGTAFEAIEYDSQGRAKASYLAPGLSAGTIGRNTFTYNVDGSTTLIDALGLTTQMTFSNINGVINVASLSKPCGSCGIGGAQSRLYDSAGYIRSTTDFNGSTTIYSYDDVRGLETQRTEALGTSSQRTVITVPDTDFNVPLRRTVVSNGGGSTSSSESMTKWSYNRSGQVLYRCDIDLAVYAARGYACNTSRNAPPGVRMWNYDYWPQGPLANVDGPRTDVTDVTNYSYYSTSNVLRCRIPGSLCNAA